MWFSLKSPTTPKKVPLDILQSQSNWPWDAQGHKVNGQTRQGASDKGKPALTFI